MGRSTPPAGLGESILFLGGIRRESRGNWCAARVQYSGFVAFAPSKSFGRGVKSRRGTPAEELFVAFSITCSGAVFVRPTRRDVRHVKARKIWTLNPSISMGGPLSIVRVENMAFSGREHRNDSERSRRTTKRGG